MNKPSLPPFEDRLKATMAAPTYAAAVVGTILVLGAGLVLLVIALW